MTTVLPTSCLLFVVTTFSIGERGDRQSMISLRYGVLSVRQSRVCGV